MRYNDELLPHRLRPELRTTASGVARQGTWENYVPARLKENKRRKRGERQVKRQRKLRKGRRTFIRVGTSSSSSYGRASTPGQTETGLGPRIYPFTTPGSCTAGAEASSDVVKPALNFVM